MEEFSALGQMDKSDVDSESKSMHGCEVPGTSHETVWMSWRQLGVRV